MASAAYEPVEAADEDEKDDDFALEGNARRDKHALEDEEGEEQHDDDLELRDLEGEEGYELKQIAGSQGRREGRPSEQFHDDDDDDQEEVLHHRRRRSSAESFELYTPDEERCVRRKLTTHLVLFVALLYLAAFLDRSNIGNAKIAGLIDDLHLDDNQYEWLLTAFYITYILFQWLALMYKVVPPHIWISLCVGSWGVLASAQALVSSWPPLLALRTLLGIGEAAFGSGVPFYLSFFTKRDEHAFAMGIFIAAAPLATSFASSLAYGIVQLGDRIGIASWRLLFLVEGFPAVLLAVWTWHWLPDSPATARWLSPRERKVATIRLRNEVESSSSVEKAHSRASPSARKKWTRHLDASAIKRTLRDPKSYVTSAIFFCCNVAFSSMPVFLPTIINSLGFSPANSQGLSAPPFLFAFVVVLLTSHLSDRFKSRSVPLIIHAILAMLGYLTLAFTGALHSPHSTALSYVAVFPICAGFFSAVTLVISWTIINQSSDSAKGTAQAVLQTIGQTGPLLGTRLYPDSAAPGFAVGHSVCAVAMALVAALAYGLRVVLRRENERRRERWKEADGGQGVPLVGDGSGKTKGKAFELML